MELTIYWNDNWIGIHNGQIGPQGLITGTTFDKNHPQTTAQFHSAAVVSCAAIAVTDTRPTLALGRTGPRGPSLPVCDQAKSARARNSPHAARLEALCTAQGGSSAEVAPPPLALGRILLRSRSLLQPLLQTPWRVTDRARAPHDLVNGPITYYGQDGEQIYQIVIGVPIAVACTYNLDLVPGPISFGVQPWNGRIQIGGQVPQNLKFQGDPQGGQHQGRVFWTPQATGRTPITCALNQGFERFEANPGNNFHTDRIEVVAAPAP